MVLSVEEEALVHAVRTLPAREAHKLFAWATQLVDLAQGKDMEWSDAWEAEDLRDATIASLQKFESEEKSQS
jgi:hypothetical protein